jgi:hypothetical protein
MGIRLDLLMRVVEDCESLEQARAVVQSAYPEIARVPESQNVRVGVSDPATGRIVFILPSPEPGDG